MLNNVQIQMNLKYLGYYDGKIDGKIGTKSIAGIKAFQKAYGLDVDGIFGKKTNAKMIEVIKAEQERLGVEQDGVAGTITTQARDNQLSWSNIKHFQKSEFTCKCGCRSNNMNLEVVKVADEIRSHFGKPAIVNSGYRCTKHNKNVGGVSNSRHLKGKAIDLYVRGVSGQTLLAYTKQLVSQGKLRYTYLIAGDAVHIDIE